MPESMPLGQHPEPARDPEYIDNRPISRLLDGDLPVMPFILQLCESENADMVHEMFVDYLRKYPDSPAWCALDEYFTALPEKLIYT